MLVSELRASARPSARLGAMRAPAIAGDGDRGGPARCLGVAAVPPGLIGYGRFLATYTSLPTFLFTGEGMNSSIAVSELANGYRNFHVSGKVEASSEPQDMRLQRLLGHLSALVQGDPKIGAGRGVRRRRHRGIVRAVSRHQAHRDLRTGAADSAIGRSVLQQGELRRPARSAGRVRVRRRAALHPDDQGEVRHHHLGSDPSVGSRGGDAVHQGISRAGAASTSIPAA